MNDKTAQYFGTQLLTLPAIFKDHFFTIPDYQRGYAWDEKQVIEMLKDIDHLIYDGIEMRHYTGTLVLSKPLNGVLGEYHVVDGQQRLTTLIILLSLLAEYLPENEKLVFTKTYIRRGEIGSDRSVLRLNSDTRSFFERVITGDVSATNEPPTLEAHERLLSARKAIQLWLKAHANQKTSIQEIRHAVETELGFLVYAPIEDAETGIMFEVINNRGKSLSELEKVKNYLIYCCVKLQARTLRESINSDWSVILNNLNTAKKTKPADEGAFLRYCVVVHFKLNKTDSQYGYDELKKRLLVDGALRSSDLKENLIKVIEDFVSFMKTAALWYARLYGQQHSGLNVNLKPVLDKIRAQGQHASIMPLFLALVIKLDGGCDRLQKLLNLLEVLNFRVYMARNMTGRNDTGQGDLYFYASRYYHSELFKNMSDEDKKIGREKIKNDDDALEFRLTEFINRSAPDSLFKESFILQRDSQDDFFKWSGLRYFLMNYEVTLQPNKTIQIDKIRLSRSEGKSGDFLSVEHLWATENKNKPGENDRNKDRFEKRRLGNFCLLELRLNIQGSKDDIAIKVPRYLKGLGNEPGTDLAQVKFMAKDAKNVITEMEDCVRNRKNYYSDLHREINNRQEVRYIKFAERRWSIKSNLGYQYLKKLSNDDAEGDE